MEAREGLADCLHSEAGRGLGGGENNGGGEIGVASGGVGEELEGVRSGVWGAG